MGNTSEQNKIESKSWTLCRFVQRSVNSSPDVNSTCPLSQVTPSARNPNTNDPCVFTQHKNNGGKNQSAPSCPCSNRSRMIRVITRNTAPKSWGRSVKNGPTVGISVTHATNAALLLPHLSVA